MASNRVDGGEAQVVYILNGGGQALIQGDGIQPGARYVADLPLGDCRLASLNVECVSGKAAIAGVECNAPITPGQLVGWWVKRA